MMKRLISCVLVALLAGCIPIGFQARTSSVSPAVQPAPATPINPSSGPAA
jgi:hypothetical protein